MSVGPAKDRSIWNHVGVGAPPILVCFSGDWDVHWGYGILTHGHIARAACHLLVFAERFNYGHLASMRPSADSLQCYAVVSCFPFSHDVGVRVFFSEGTFFWGFV